MFIEKYKTIDFDEEVSEIYLIVNISYFDHWYTNEEFIETDLYCYSQVKNDESKQILFDKICDRFTNFYKLLYDFSKKSVLVSSDRYPPIHQARSFIEIKKYTDYLDYVKSAVKEEPLYSFFYPSLNCFTFSGYDLTHEFFILKDKNQGEILIKNKLEDFASVSQLHVLE